jgi:transposase
VSRGRFEARIRQPIEGHDMLATVIGAMLQARAALWNEFTRLHRAMLQIARADPVCHRLMSAPGVGALVALTYRSAVDNPGRFAKSRTVGAYFGLTPQEVSIRGDRHRRRHHQGRRFHGANRTL